MKEMIKRVKSNMGASFVLALVTFIIITILATTIVNAALTNASQVRTQQKAEQAYLSVRSASWLLQDMLLAEADENSRYIHITKTERETTDPLTGEVTSEAPEYTYAAGSGIPSSMSGTLCALTEAWVHRTETGALSFTPVYFTISTDDSEAGEAIGSVRAIVDVEEKYGDYSMVIGLGAPYISGVSDENQVYGYTSRVLLTPHKQESAARVSTVGNVKTTVTDTYVYWDQATNLRGAQ